MKRLCSLLLIGCMLLASCLFFASCNAISEDNLLTNPYAVLNDASKNTLNAFFTDDAEIGKKLIGMLPTGALTVSFESDDIDGESLKLSETVYYDITDRSYVYDTNIAFSETDLLFRMYSDNENFAFGSEDILGSNKTLLVNFDTFIEKFADSELVKLLELDKTDVDNAVDYVKTIKESLNSELAQDEEKATELSNSVYKLLIDEVTTEKTVNSDGKNVDCVVATLDIDNESIEAVLDEILLKADFDENTKADTEEAFDEIIKSMNDDTIIDISVKFYLNKRTNEYVKITVDGSVTDTADVDDSALIEVEMLFAETEITVGGSVNYDNEPVSFDAILTKTVTDASAEYKFTLDATDGEEDINAINATFKYDKATGDITVSADIYNYEDDRGTLLLEGNLSANSDKIALVFDTLKADEETYEFKFELSVTSDVTVPTLPADAIDVVDITEGGWLDIINEFQTSEIGKLLFGSLNGEY